LAEIDFHLDTLLARGSTSEVWSATRLGPAGFAVPAAVKALSVSFATSAEHLRAFLSEARAASYVQHRNVVQTRELVLINGRYWLGMDLVRGWTVNALLAAVAATRKPIPFPIVLALARDAAAGLQAIHDAGLVHRNVTPDNLMVDVSGSLSILDFGCATWQLAERVHFTQPLVAFDPAYSSPEILAGLPVDARTDVFSVGALLHRLVPRRPDVPFVLEGIIARAVDPDPRRRFASAADLEIALEAVSFREGWLVTPSYVSAYVNDVLRAMPVVRLPRAPEPRPELVRVEAVQPAPAAARAPAPAPAPAMKMSPRPAPKGSTPPRPTADGSLIMPVGTQAKVIVASQTSPAPPTRSRGEVLGKTRVRVLRR
jgi:serine/threonine protein kinase